MIARIWHGWTSPGNADAYEALLKAEIFPGIAAKGVEGYRGIRLLRRPPSNRGDRMGGAGTRCLPREARSPVRESPVFL